MKIEKIRELIEEVIASDDYFVATKKRLEIEKELTENYGKSEFEVQNLIDAACDAKKARYCARSAENSKQHAEYREQKARREIEYLLSELGVDKE